MNGSVAARVWTVSRGRDRWKSLQRGHRGEKRLEWWRERLKAVQGLFPVLPLAADPVCHLSLASSGVRGGSQALRCLLLSTLHRHHSLWGLTEMMSVEGPRKL